MTCATCELDLERCQCYASVIYSECPRVCRHWMLDWELDSLVRERVELFASNMARKLEANRANIACAIAASTIPAETVQMEQALWFLQELETNFDAIRFERPRLNILWLASLDVEHQMKHLTSPGRTTAVVLGFRMMAERENREARRAS